MEPEPLIPKHGGYRKLKSFQIAQLCSTARSKPKPELSPTKVASPNGCTASERKRKSGAETDKEDPIGDQTGFGKDQPMP
ncbi:MAG TPA: hypothetical protein VGW39_03705 [Chthoniobacterales bacterium]|nr:hypothetical protein [Chthoniobacterales bacterium]